MTEPVVKSALLESEDKSTGQIDPDAPLKFVASDETKDRYGDVIRVTGWDVTNFKKNPIALFNHSSANIVGTVPRTWVEGKKLMSEMRLAAAGSGQIVDYVRALVQQRILRAVSVSFLPSEAKEMVKDGRFDGYEYLKQELLEVSLVAIPANPAAVAVARTLNIPEEVQRSVLFAPAYKGTSAKRARITLESLRERSHLKT